MPQRVTSLEPRAKGQVEQPEVHVTKRSDGLLPFFLLACGFTWALDVPMVSAWLAHREPSVWALLAAAASAFGPTFAALLIAGPRRELGAVFGRWRTNPLWIVLALFAPLLLHLPATALEVALGGAPAQWLYLPDTSERVAALIVFSIGEEFGWRGFAQPRMAARFGPVAGPLLLGVVWAVWHALMIVTPAGEVDWLGVAVLLATLPLWSVIFAWFLERANGSIAVAIALHAGGHLDNSNLAPASELRLRVLTLAVLLVAAGFAARSLTATRPAPRP